MATNLFDKYYNNPTKSYIYSNILCNGVSADEYSFDINGSMGEITSNSDVLAKIDLSDVNVGATQYTNNMSIINPYDFIYIKGMCYGDTYASKTFGRVINDLWESTGMIFFAIKYIDSSTGEPILKTLKCGAIPDTKTVIDVLNDYFNETNVKIKVSYDNGYITFTSTEVGYDFWIDHMMVWTGGDPTDIMNEINDWMVDNEKTYRYGWDDEYIINNNVEYSTPYIHKNVYSSVIRKSDYERIYNLFNCLSTDFNTMLENNNVQKVWLYEIFSKRVSPKKYRNGAMKGIMIKATYPIYNDESISDFQRSLKIAHLKDSVEEWYMVPESLFTGTCVATRKIIDVVDSYHSEYDSEMYNRWMGEYSHINGKDNWIDSDEVPQVVPEMFSLWESSHVPYSVQAGSIYRDMETREAMGLKGYCAYCSKNNLWVNMGQIYTVTTASDDENPEHQNLIPGIVIYNPNPFPVTINYIAFG